MKNTLLKFDLLSLSKIFVILLFVGVVSCNNNDDDNTVSVGDYDSIKTESDAEYWQNNNPKTYYLVNDVTWMTDENGQGNSNPNLTITYDNAILDQIDENMKDLGYTKLTSVDSTDSTSTPDLILTAKAVATTYSSGDYYWDWNNWWSFYDPYYPWGPGYYYPVFYQWTQGTVVVEMGDYSSLNISKNTINIVWGGAINGLVRSTQTGNVQFIESKIDAVFDASPYLKVE